MVFGGGQPSLIVAVAQVDDQVTLARLASAGGQSDSMEPVDGVVALAIELPAGEAVDEPFEFDRFPMGVDLAGVSFELLAADGTSERISGDALFSGLALWNDPECIDAFDQPIDTGPPETLPPPTVPSVDAELPLDPAAAEASIRAAMERLYTGLEHDDVLLGLVDDPSGLDFLIDEVFARWPGGAFEEMTVEVLEVGFFSPVEASFVYRPVVDLVPEATEGDVEPQQWWWQYGRARLIDGVWKITRSTICADIEKSGIRCTI